MTLLSPSNSLAADTHITQYKMIGHDTKGEYVAADLLMGPNGNLSGILYQGFQVHDVSGTWTSSERALVKATTYPCESFDLEVVDTIRKRRILDISYPRKEN